MKKIISFLLFFSFGFIALTLLSNKIEKLEEEINKVDSQNKKLIKNISFLRSEWEFKSSPANIESMVRENLDYKVSQLISIEDFLIFLNYIGENN